MTDVEAAKAPDEKLAAWRRVFLSAPAVFTVVGGGDSLYWHSFHRRQQVVQTYDSLKRSARQLAFEVTAFKNKKESEAGERLGVKEVQDIFRPPHGEILRERRHGGWIREGLPVRL